MNFVNYEERHRRQQAISTELLLRRLQKHHGVKTRNTYPVPVVIVPNPLKANYRVHRERQLRDKLELCRTKFGRVTIAV
jgi:hypothetical protein